MKTFLMHLIPAVALLTLACGVPESSTPYSSSEDMLPLIIIMIGDYGVPSAELPWTISEGATDVSAAMISVDAPDDEEESPAALSEQILREALAEGMLIALIDFGDLPGDLERDHIHITTGPGGLPSSTPAGIAEDIPDSVWRDPLLRQNWIANMVDIYLPDLTIIGLNGFNRAAVIDILRSWTQPERLAGMNIVAVHLAGEPPPEERGWAVIGSSSVNGNTPNGLTHNALLSTMELLCGLDWESAVPDRIPALDIFISPPPGWNLE